MYSTLFNPTIYARALELVRKYILNNSGNLDEVNDVFQESLLIFFQKAKSNTLNLNGNPEKYILGISKNIWLKELSKRKRLVLVENYFDSIEDDSSWSLKIKERKEFFISIIERNIKKLSPKCQEIFAYKKEGLSSLQIAERMNFSSSQISKDKTFRCKKRLLYWIYQDEEFLNFINES